MPANLVSELSGAAMRACALGLIAFLGLSLFRVRSAAARHATWTVVVLGMLLQIALGSAVSTLQVNVLPNASTPGRHAATETQRIPAPHRALSPAGNRNAQPKHWISKAGVLVGVYFGVSMLLFARMALGWWRLRRMLQDAKPLPELGPWFLESTSFVVPASVGCLRPRILLPRGWRDWDSARLKAVLAHETAHTQRRDWLVCLISRVNVCLFWFHPLAWWMDRELAYLAEEACDDIALSELEDRDQYAATLVEFARRAAANGALLNRGGISMAKQSNLARRLNRIVNEHRQAGNPFGRVAWIMLLTCSMPVIYLSASVELAPAKERTAGLEHAELRENPPKDLIAQSPPKPSLRSAPPPSPSRPDNLLVSMCILMDHSGSMLGKQTQAKAAALGLVRASKPDDEFCIVGFNDEAYLSADLTTDLEKAEGAVMQVDSRGGSALRDAVSLSIDVVVQKARNRKVLVVITDGGDTSSAVTEEQVRDRIRNSGILVYSIALSNGQDMGEVSEAKRTLTQLTALTGGRYYQPEPSAEIERIASEIMSEARSK